MSENETNTTAPAPEAKEQTGLWLWKKWEKTEKAFTKKFDNGSFKGTDINPTYRARKMTEVLGPYGEAWGLQNVRFEHRTTHIEGEVLVICHAELWWLDPDTGNKCVCGPHTGCDYLIKQTKSSGMRTDVEVYKKVQTDCMTSAFRFLGISADVYMGLWDNSRYQNMIEKEGQIDLSEFMGEEPAVKKGKAAAEKQGPPAQQQPPPLDGRPPVEPTEAEKLAARFKQVLDAKVAELTTKGVPEPSARRAVIRKKDELKMAYPDANTVLDMLEKAIIHAE